MIRTILELIYLVRTILKIINDLKDESAKAKALKEINDSFTQADANKLNAVFSKLHNRQ